MIFSTLEAIKSSISHIVVLYDLCSLYYGLLFIYLFLFYKEEHSLCIRFLETYSRSCYAGSPPLVIAQGGFSGVFPDSSLAAYNLALLTGTQNVIVWCDVQLTKDGAGICLPDIKLENATNIANIFPNKTANYEVNGEPTRGYFSVDYTLKDLSAVERKFN